MTHYTTRARLSAILRGKCYATYLLVRFFSSFETRGGRHQACVGGPQACAGTRMPPSLRRFSPDFVILAVAPTGRVSDSPSPPPQASSSGHGRLASPHTETSPYAALGICVHEVNSVCVSCLFRVCCLYTRERNGENVERRHTPAPCLGAWISSVSLPLRLCLSFSLSLCLCLCLCLSLCLYDRRVRAAAQLPGLTRA